MFAGPAADVFRGMATLALGSGAAKLVGIASIPILTRIYSPEDFGVLAVFTAFVALLAPILTWRYVLAIPLPRHDGLAINLLVLSAALMLATTLLLTVVLWAFAAPLLRALSMEALVPWWWLVAVGLLAAGTYEMLTLWATRKRAYKIIAQTSVWQSAAGAIVKIALGLLTLKPAGLLIGQVVAKGGGIGSLLRSFQADFSASWRHLRLTRMKKLAVRHRGFPIYRVPSQILLVFSMQSPLLVAAALYGPEITGQFSLAFMVIAVPMSLFGNAISKSLYGEAASIQSRDPNEIAQLASATQKRLLLFSIPPALLFFFGAEQLFLPVFGSDWLAAGKICSILSIYLVFQLCCSPTVQIMNFFRSQFFFLGQNMIRVALLISLYFGVYYFEIDYVLFAWLYSTFMAIFYCLLSFTIFQILKKA